MHSAPPTGPDLVAVNSTTPDASVTVRLDSFRQKVVAKMSRQGGKERWLHPEGDIHSMLEMLK